MSTFAPTDDAPVPESYRLGVGDQLVVQLFGKENNQLNLQVGRSGDISFPKLGSITLAGLTFEDARDLINTRVKQQLIGVDAVVSKVASGKRQDERWDQLERVDVGQAKDMLDRRNTLFHATENKQFVQMWRS